METPKIIELIHERFPGQYTDEKINHAILPDILDCPEPIKSKLFHFLETGKVEDMEVEGYNVERFKKDFGFNEIAAYLNLAWLVREPEEAKRAFIRGFDRIIT